MNESAWSWVRACALSLTLMVCAGRAIAQDDPFKDQPTDEGASSPSEPSATAPADEPAAQPGPESSSSVAAPSPREAAAAGNVGATPSAIDASASAEAGAGAPKVDRAATSEIKPGQDTNPVRTGSNIRRPLLMPDGALVIDGPLATEVQGRDYLQMRRQLGGVALPDTTAALGQGGPGTSSLELRLQPTLILLNGHRLVSAPYFGPSGSDFVDINQLPIQLIERAEFVRGNVAGVYGDGAVGGAVNFITQRNYKGVEVEVGGQATDKFDQHEEDVALTLGAGSEKTGMNVMVSYFNRSPLAATDRDWIHDRDNRVNSLLGSPSSFQPLTNFQYPFPDPYCDIATKAGHADGLQVRIRGYGPPETLNLLPQDVQDNLLMTYDVARGNSNGKLEALETATYCSGNFTPDQDLILKDERIQTYSTFWHKFTEHTEGYGELGYYRSNNSNRTAPSFPIIRLTPDVNNITPVWVPADHADQPVQARGFAAADVATGRVPNQQFIVGRIIGTYAGPGVNTRRVDVFRGVLGVRGDLKAAGAGSVLETWDWDVSGVYSGSEAVSSVQDVLLDKLRTALNSCPATIMMGRNMVPSTIKQRQEMGCFNPFYSSVTNSAALDPLHVSNRTPASSHGFITTDSDAAGQMGHGVQDGGYICDPNDPNSPSCPAAFDRDKDAMGTFELAGTPNTKQVVDRLLGDQITVQRRALATADATMRGDIVHFDGGGLSFGAGGQFRRESMSVNYDAAYNQRLYGFLFGAPDVPNVGRNIAAGYAELRLRLLKGAVEIQPAGRVEHYQTVGTAVSPMVGLALRPFAASDTPPPALEWLILRGHVGRGNRAPSLLQMYGSQTEFESVDFFGSTLFVPHQISGNPNLDFEKYTTISGGVQWDYVGMHVGADFWTTQIKDLIAGDNSKTLSHDCEAQYMSSSGDCGEIVLLQGNRILDHFESRFDNLAAVSTNGIDGGASYSLDTKKRGLGDIGTFVLGVQGTFINSYLIKSPRALREYYRVGDQLPKFHTNGTRDYSGLTAEYEAAGYRNLDNFAPPIPRLRFAVPLRWMFGQHLVGVTMRYVSGYNDDSEWTVERYGLPGINDLANAPGEAIPAWTVFDVNYGLAFGDDPLRIRLTLGVLNVLDTPPPAVESPLGYEVGIHDPRGRMLYVRATGSF